jgi:cell division transport system permease protein
VFGLQGGLIGGGAAILLFVLGSFLTDWFRAAPEREQIAALFGTLSLGVDGYAAVVGQAILIAAVTAITSRFTVHRTLKSID